MHTVLLVSTYHQRSLVSRLFRDVLQLLHESVDLLGTFMNDTLGYT